MMPNSEQLRRTVLPHPCPGATGMEPLRSFYSPCASSAWGDLCLECACDGPGISVVWGTLEIKKPEKAPGPQGSRPPPTQGGVGCPSRGLLSHALTTVCSQPSEP